MKYWISETNPNMSEYDYSDVHFFKEVSSWEKLEANLAKLAGRVYRRRRFTVYCDNLPCEYLEMCMGEIVHRRATGDFRKDCEKDMDFFYEGKSKKWFVGRKSGDLSDWILQSGSLVEKVVREKKVVNKAPARRKVNNRVWVKRGSAKRGRIKKVRGAV
jgi:hypothetical protein